MIRVEYMTNNRNRSGVESVTFVVSDSMSEKDTFCRECVDVILKMFLRVLNTSAFYNRFLLECETADKKKYTCVDVKKYKIRDPEDAQEVNIVMELNNTLYDILEDAGSAAFNGLAVLCDKHRYALDVYHNGFQYTPRRLEHNEKEE